MFFTELIKVLMRFTEYAEIQKERDWSGLKKRRTFLEKFVKNWLRPWKITFTHFGFLKKITSTFKPLIAQEWRKLTREYFFLWLELVFYIYYVSISCFYLFENNICNLNTQTRVAFVQLIDLFFMNYLQYLCLFRIHMEFFRSPG